jgi:osomolarity two-component system, response regulator SKN7
MSSTSPGPYSSSSTVEALQHQVDRLNQAHDDMSAHVRSLERSYQDVLVEMVNFQRNMAQQDNLMQNLIQYFLNSETGA